ncbi:MAG: hypothetical protein AAGA72_06985 [Pseudomonadota bacterium]
MRLSSFLFSGAAGVSVLGAVAHELVGAPKVLGPLADTNLPADVIWLHHFSWHVGTVAVLVMAALFLAAARTPSGRPLALFACLMSTGFAALGIGLAVFASAVLWTTPAPYPWTLVAGLGWLGLFFTRNPEREKPAAGRSTPPDMGPRR